MAYDAVLIVSKRLQVVAAALICLMAGRLVVEVIHAQHPPVTSVRMAISGARRP